MLANRGLLIEDEEAYLDMHFRRALLMQMSRKKRLRVLKAWADEVSANKVVPISGVPASEDCVARARAILRVQMPILLKA